MMETSIMKGDLQPSKLNQKRSDPESKVPSTYVSEDVLSQFKERGKVLEKKATKFKHWVPIFIICIGFFAISMVFVYTVVPVVPVVTLANANTTELSSVGEMNDRIEHFLTTSNCEYAKNYVKGDSGMMGRHLSHHDIMTSRRATWFMSAFGLGFVTVGPVVHFARHNLEHPCSFGNFWVALLYICPWLVVFSSIPLVIFSDWLIYGWDWLRTECTIAIVCGHWLMWIMALLTTVPPTFDDTVENLKKVYSCCLCCRKGPSELHSIQCQDDNLCEPLAESPKKATSDSSQKKLHTWTGEFGVQFWCIALLPAPYFLLATVELFGVLRSFLVPTNCAYDAPELQFTFDVAVITTIIIHLTIWGALAATFLVLLFAQVEINLRNQRDYRVGKLLQRVGEDELRTTWANDPRVLCETRSSLLKKAIDKCEKTNPPKELSQPSKYIDELYCEAYAVNEWFHKEIDEIRNDLNLPDPKILMKELKKQERSIDKVHLSYFSAAELCDIVRGSIECKDLDEVLKTFEHIVSKSAKKLKILRIKNKFDKEKEKTEYRALHLSVQLCGYDGKVACDQNRDAKCNCEGHGKNFIAKCQGHIGEIQIKLTQPEKAKSGSDGSRDREAIAQEKLEVIGGNETPTKYMITHREHNSYATRDEMKTMRDSFLKELDNNDAAAYLRRVRQAYRDESKTQIVKFYYGCKFYIQKWFWYSRKSSARLARTEEQWKEQGFLLKAIIEHERWPKKGHDLYKISRFLLKQ